MSTIEAGWALLGKRPGSFDDYAVIAASRGPFSSAQFQQIIFGYSPGNPPASRGASADALPWVSFSSASLQDSTFVGIAVRDWSGHTDGTNRPIAFTRYLCVRLDDVGDVSVTFSDLYRAVQEPKVKDIQLRWDVADPLAGEPLALQLPAPNPKALAGLVDTIGVARVAAGAAALFEGPVAVLGGTTDLMGRLEFLDAVAALLPAGARAWLSVSSWADSGTNHRLSLAFTQRGRTADRRLSERGDCEGPQQDAAQRYRDELVRLSRVKGTVAVMGHLATLSTLREQHAEEALEALAELDLAAIVLRRAQDSTLKPADVRRLGALGRFGDLSAAQREVVLSRYLAVAAARDVTSDLQLLVEQWSQGLDAHLVHVANHRLWQDRWPVPHLAPFAAVADRVGAREAFLGVLHPPGSGSTGSPPGLAAAAAFVTHLETEWRHDTRLPAVVGQAPALALAVLRQHLSTDPDEVLNWINRFESPTRSGPRNGLAALTMPFKVVLLNGPEPADSTQIAALAQVDPAVVPDLVSACQSGRPDRLELLLRGVLPWLHRELATLGAVQQQRWAKELKQLAVADEGRQAEIDLLLYRLGRSPVRPPVEAVHDGQGPRRGYLDSFVKHTWDADLPDQEHRRLISALVQYLKRGWSAPESRFEAVLDLLWGLSHGPHTGQSRVPKSVLVAIVENIGNNIELVHHRAFERWMEDLRGYPDLQRQVSLARMRGIPANASISAAAEFMVELLIGGYSDKQVIGVLEKSEYRPPGDQIGDLLHAVTAGLERANYPDPYLFSYVLGSRIIKDNAELHPDRAATVKKPFPSRLFPQALLEALLFLEATRKGGEVTRMAMLQRMDTLKDLHEILGETIAQLEQVRRDWRHESASSKARELLRGFNPLTWGRQPEDGDPEQRPAAEQQAHDER